MANLRFESYLPTALEQLGEKELRKEYSRLRDIAQKRLQRLSEGGYETSVAYRMNRDRYKKLRDIRSTGELVERLSDLSRFIEARSSSVTGQKGIERDRLASLKESGYDFVNRQNLREFGEFMNYMKSLFPKHPSASAEVASALFAGYREKRAQAKTPQEMHDLFTAWLEKEKPDTYYLQPAFREVPTSKKYKTPWG